MRRSVIETVMGAVVLLVAGVFLAFAYNATDFSTSGGYSVTAKFNSVDGLTLGSDVRIGGVKIGSVTGARIDPQLFQAEVEMSIRKEVRVPVDSQVSVVSDGLLGGKFVKIDPGRKGELAEDGSTLPNTKDVLALEDLLGKAIFLVTGEDPQ